MSFPWSLSPSSKWQGLRAGQCHKKKNFGSLNGQIIQPGLEQEITCDDFEARKMWSCVLQCLHILANETQLLDFEPWVEMESCVC